ncbi:MAG: NAD(P)H-binding protein [Bdellovibrionota bacterium]|nr:NAD(P)H-binding protein [Bdellovibrionota bacterium]
MAKIAIAGASGFVGARLIQELLDETDHDIVALSRSEKTSIAPDRLKWKQCDIFSLLDIEKALEDCDVGIYLVHSMLPSAHLVQGDFEDFDLLLADNFAKAAKSRALKQIIYLGGIIPENEHLSRHLKSRLEVEQAFKEVEVPLTSLRAGLVIGDGGSSFRIMQNLVRRLPVMVCPRWTQIESSPIYIDDVLQSIKFCILNQSCFSKEYDLAGRGNITYIEMMRYLAGKYQKKPLFIPVRFFSPSLSKLWVSLVAGAPKNLVYPLIASLKHKMLASEKMKLVIPNYKLKSPQEAIDLSYQFNPKNSPKAFKYQAGSEHNEVRSLQRIVLSKNMTAQSVAEEYFHWLPKFFKFFVYVKIDDLYVKFMIAGVNLPLLILKFAPDRSTVSRQLFYVRGGLLAKGVGRGRLEFREIFKEKLVIAGIHEFKPRLPWYLYKWTQALIHLFTMHAFIKYLYRKKA